MLSPSDPNWHQSPARAGLATCWKLEAGRAHGWRTRTDHRLTVRKLAGTREAASGCSAWCGLTSVRGAAEP